VCFDLTLFALLRYIVSNIRHIGTAKIIINDEKYGHIYLFS